MVVRQNRYSAILADAQRNSYDAFSGAAPALVASTRSAHRKPGDAAVRHDRRTEPAIVLQSASRLALEEASSYGVRCCQHAEETCLPQQDCTSTHRPSTNGEVPT